jgi:hemerythrin-like domain-containing protein
MLRLYCRLPAKALRQIKTGALAALHTRWQRVPGCRACGVGDALDRGDPMQPSSLKVIKDEHASLAAMLQSMRMLIQRGPQDHPEQFFDVLRAMLFYIDEVPERQHHPKESHMLFPLVAASDPGVRATLARLEQDHQAGERAVRELQHLLLGWELMGEGRRPVFIQACLKYIDFYLEHMRLEETQILPAAQQHLTPEQWAELDLAFASNRDPLRPEHAQDPDYARLFTRIVMHAPAPIGVGRE